VKVLLYNNESKNQEKQRKEQEFKKVNQKKF